MLASSFQLWHQIQPWKTQFAAGIPSSSAFILGFSASQRQNEGSEAVRLLWCLIYKEICFSNEQSLYFRRIYWGETAVSVAFKPKTGKNLNRRKCGSKIFTKISQKYPPVCGFSTFLSALRISDDFYHWWANYRHTFEGWLCCWRNHIVRFLFENLEKAQNPNDEETELKKYDLMRQNHQTEMWVWLWNKSCEKHNDDPKVEETETIPFFSFTVFVKTGFKSKAVSRFSKRLYKCSYF